MITMLIFTVISGGLYSVFAAGDNSWQINKVKIELQQELRKAMEGMINDLRQASIEDVGYSEITLKVPQGVVSGKMVWGADAIQYVLGGADGKQLQRIQGGVTRIVAQDIEAVSFLRSGASSDALVVSLQAERAALKGPVISRSLNFEVQLRN
jgi:hypothetical protein